MTYPFHIESCVRGTTHGRGSQWKAFLYIQWKSDNITKFPYLDDGVMSHTIIRLSTPIKSCAQIFYKIHNSSSPYHSVPFRLHKFKLKILLSPQLVLFVTKTVSYNSSHSDQVNRFIRRHHLPSQHTAMFEYYSSFFGRACTCRSLYRQDITY